MASTTIVKYPDGRTEQKNVLSSFEKNGTNIIVFETEKVDNNHKVVGVSYLADGLYQNVIDADKWNEVKHNLVDILHDNVSMEEYKIVPEEILVTEDPYHPIALREENYDKLVSSYEQFKNNVAMEQPAPVVENTTETLESVEPVQNIITDEPVQPINLENQEPIVEATPTVEPAPVIENEDVVDPFAIADSLENNIVTPAPTESFQDIFPPVGIDIPTPSITDINPVEDVIPTNEQPQEEIKPEENIIETPATIDFNNLADTEQPNLEATENISSPVKESYENRTSEILKQMRELSEDYLKRMEEMSAEISRNLEEARGINELAKQTLDKAQTIVPITNEQPLELTRAA
jgi:hypothetical protein